MAETPVTKTELRRALKQRAAALPDAYKKEADARIFSAVTESDVYKTARSLFIYVSMPGEPDTRALLAHALAAGKAVYVPKCLGPRTMRAVRITDLTQLSPGAYGIPAPPDAPAEQPEPHFDLAAVPCVSAWTDGRRLGRGGGYYDAFFARTKTVKLCLCYAALLSAEIPVEAHDIRMDLLATEHGAVPCAKGR